MTARLWTHRDLSADEYPHALMYGDDLVAWFPAEDVELEGYAMFCAIEAQLAPFVDLPDGVVLRPVLPPEQPCPDGWEADPISGYRGDSSPWPDAVPIRRVPEPPAPETEKVQLHKVIGHRPPGCGFRVHRVICPNGGGAIAENKTGLLTFALAVDDDGMVEVLKG